MRIAIASDHGGLNLRAVLVTYLNEAGHVVHDMGPAESTSVDYPDYAAKVAAAVLEDAADRGVLVCGTGQGMAMSANKIPGVRAAVVSDTYSAQMAMEHNSARVLCLGERVLGPALAIACVEAWLNADFQGGRHQRRVDKINALGA
jgi:ribose 5-phosphate isomerase B